MGTEHENRNYATFAPMPWMMEANRAHLEDTSLMIKLIPSSVPLTRHLVDILGFNIHAVSFSSLYHSTLWLW